MAKRKDLGKGIRALLSDIDTSSTAKRKTVVSELASTIENIEISSIETNPYQPRTEFDEEALQELSESIKLHGIVQPITVRSLGNNQFQLISGERRLRASQLAGKDKIPAYIRIANDQEMLEFALIENIQRQDLNAMEIALSYSRLMQECNLTHETLSTRVGKKRSTISNYLRLLKLPPEIQTAVKEERISMGHARVLAGLDIVKQMLLFNQTIENQYSVRKLEQLAKTIQTPPSKPKNSSEEEHPEIKRIRKQLSTKFGCPIQIDRSANGKGYIRIPFDSDDMFNDIIDTLDKV